VNTLTVCDTEPIAIEGLRSLLQSSDRLRVVAADTRLPDALDAIRHLKPSLFILDKGFGIHAVMNLLKTMRDSQPSTSTIVWSSNLTGPEALRLVQAGAGGVVRKTAPIETLLACIRTVAAGGTWMEEDLGGDTIDGFPRPGRYPLTSRELQVMELVERGMKNKDIAIALGIRTGTVKIHLKHIFEKTGIRGRYGLAISGLKEKGVLAMPLAEPA
jgi:DNA-binding NarL/FixJ family response regulator